MFTTELQTKQQLNKYQSLSLRQSEEFKGLEEILKNLGLQLSPLELERLCDKKFVSLENLTLAELGTLFILASAVTSHHFKEQNISFRDLLIFNGSSNCFGIPLYYWESNSSVKFYLRLTFLMGKPTIVIQNQA